MRRLLLRLTTGLTLTLISLIAAASLMGRALPAGRILPVVRYDSPTLLLLDVERRLIAARRSAPAAVTDAAISSDQQQIAFTLSDGQQSHVYAGDLYGSTYHALTPPELQGEAAAWSPDHRHIVFVGLEPGNRRGIYTVAADGQSPPEAIVKAGTFAGPVWSGSGQQVAFTVTPYRDLPDIYVADAACRLRCDRQLRQLTNTLVADTQPLWSPDGRMLAFLSNRSGRYDIYALDMTCLQASARPCTLQTPAHLWLQPVITPALLGWSADSRELYFRGRDTQTNMPGLYAVSVSCFNPPRPCQPRLIYNLGHHQP